MSDGLSDYWAMRLQDKPPVGWHRWQEATTKRHDVERDWVENLSASDWDKPIVPRDRPIGLRQKDFDEHQRLAQHYAHTYQKSGDERIYVDAESAERYRLAAPPMAYHWLGREAEAV